MGELGGYFLDIGFICSLYLMGGENYYILVKIMFDILARCDNYFMSYMENFFLNDAKFQLLKVA